VQVAHAEDHIFDGTEEEKVFSNDKITSKIVEFLMVKI
jgi:hypothetical protein